MEAAELTRATSGLDRLETFCFPHSGLLPPSPLTDFAICPDHVRELYITGGLNFDGPTYAYIKWPSSLHHLNIRCCDQLAEENFHSILERLGPQLRTLEVMTDMTRFGGSALDNVFTFLPCIRYLALHMDYISSRFAMTLPEEAGPGSSPTVELELTSVGGCNPGFWDELWTRMMNIKSPRLRKVKLQQTSTLQLEDHIIQAGNAAHLFLQSLVQENEYQDDIMEKDETQAGIWFVPWSDTMDPKSKFYRPGTRPISWAESVWKENHDTVLYGLKYLRRPTFARDDRECEEGLWRCGDSCVQAPAFNGYW